MDVHDPQLNKIQQTTKHKHHYRIKRALDKMDGGKRAICAPGHLGDSREGRANVTPARTP